MQYVEDVTDVVRLKVQGIEQNKIIRGFNLARRSIENERSNFRNLFKQTPEINGIMILGTEVTEQVISRESLRSSQLKLEEAIRFRDEFLSIASHELKTTLTSMKIQTQMFNRNVHKDPSTVLAPTKVAQMVSIFDSGLNRLIRLVEDMLDISRIQTGKLSFELELVRLDLFLKEFLERMKPDLATAGIELSSELAPDVLSKIDRFRLEQVFTNLTTNAIRYAPGVPLKVGLKKEKNSTVIFFKDHGPGISGAEAEKVFLQFERLVPATNVSGLGLGLYICRQIVEGHGGKIKVEKDGSVGALFVIELPIIDSSETNVLTSGSYV